MKPLNPAVAVMNDSSAKIKAFLFSLFIHLMLLMIATYLLHAVDTKLVSHEEHLVRVSLAEFTPTVKKSMPVHKVVQAKPISKPIVHHVVHKEVVHKRVVHKVIDKKVVHKNIHKKIVKKVEKTIQKSAPHYKVAVKSSETFSSPVSKSSSIVQKDVKKVVSPQRISAQRFKKVSNPPQKSRTLSSSKLAKIRSMIESAVVYPAIAHKLGLEGVVIVSFILTKQGVVKTAKILSSSGSSSLDTEALQAILSLSGKYPKLKRLASLKMPISFSLSHS